MNGGTRQSGFLEICFGSCWVQPREPAVLFARSSRGNVGELTATGEPLSQILKTKHKFIFCGLMCPAINRAQTQVTDRTKVEQAVDRSQRASRQGRLGAASLPSQCRRRLPDPGCRCARFVGAGCKSSKNRTCKSAPGRLTLPALGKGALRSQ
jgi:hypothetical protein